MSDDVTFEPIVRETLSSQIRTELLGRIERGELAPGARVPSERALAEQFAVARTSVREAMQGLVSLGVIERRGNRAFVTERLPEVVVPAAVDERKDLVKELFETRRLLEGPIFELAACRASPELRDRIAELAQDFTADMPLGTFRELDRTFHTTIASGCGNSLLIELYGKVLERLFESDAFDSLLSASRNQVGVEKIVAQAADDHRAIAKAVAAGDPTAVAAASAEHLSMVEQHMLDDLT